MFRGAERQIAKLKCKFTCETGLLHTYLFSLFDSSFGDDRLEAADLRPRLEVAVEAAAAAAAAASLAALAASCPRMERTALAASSSSRICSWNWRIKIF